MYSRISVKGMSCSACEKLITQALIDKGVSQVHVDSKNGFVDVNYEFNISLKEICSVISDEGFEVLK